MGLKKPMPQETAGGGRRPRTRSRRSRTSTCRSPGTTPLPARPARHRTVRLFKRSSNVTWPGSNLSASVTGGPVTSERFIAYGEMYAADVRFANNYGGTAGAEFVRDAISSFAAKERT